MITLVHKNFIRQLCTMFVITCSITIHASDETKHKFDLFYYKDSNNVVHNCWKSRLFTQGCGIATGLLAASLITPAPLPILGLMATGKVIAIAATTVSGWLTVSMRRRSLKRDFEPQEDKNWADAGNNFRPLPLNTPATVYYGFTHYFITPGLAAAVTASTACMLNHIRLNHFSKS